MSANPITTEGRVFVAQMIRDVTRARVHVVWNGPGELLSAADRLRPSL